MPMTEDDGYRFETGRRRYQFEQMAGAAKAALIAMLIIAAVFILVCVGGLTLFWVLNVYFPEFLPTPQRY